MARAKTYEIEFYGSCKTSLGGSSGGGYKDMLAQIALFDNDGNPCGAIQFFRDGATVPEDFSSTGTRDGLPTMHVPYVMFGDIYEALRVDKPIMIEYRERPLYEGSILSVGNQEPIGERD